MSEQIYKESNYRFTDPIRFFKANDPYYFEVDNIPLKQLQENCLWLKDQVRKDSSKLLGVKRSDIDELRPYATGSDRLVRVKPGRYTARINDASTREPLAYLRKVMGEAVGDVDAWSAATPNPGDFPDGKNAALEAALDRFKSTLAQNALGMNGLVERAFSWPVVDSDRVVDGDGADIDTNQNWLSFGGADVNIPGGGAGQAPFPIAEAILWAKSQGSTLSEFALPTFEITNTNNGFSKLPLTESYFIKAWRGVSRTAVVDIDDEISISVPNFDANDFSYTNSEGETTAVNNVQQRIDLVFIYSKPVDTSAVNTYQDGAIQKITKPTLGIVKGAGIKTNFQEKSSDLAAGYNSGSNNSILASPGDQNGTNMGFNSTSANDIAYSIKGSFPAPDDLMNLAPLISEKLEDNAYELVGQSILPVAYVFVQNGSQVVLSTDVVDIRPLFRTAELAYNERAGVGAAFPQLSLANPAVGKTQLDYEIKRAYDDLNSRINFVASETDTQEAINTLAAGYVFGGFNFGPEGALKGFYQNIFDNDEDDNNDGEAYVKSYIRSKYAFGSNAANVTIPTYPDWDLAQWCVQSEDLTDKGYYPNDYINTFISLVSDGSETDPSIATNAGSFRVAMGPDGQPINSATSDRLRNFANTRNTGAGVTSKVNFHYISKKIKFNRPEWLGDYLVDVSFVHCLPQNTVGQLQNAVTAGSYFGTWVEKGFNEFTIYVAFAMEDNNNFSNTSEAPRFPGPHTLSYTTSGKKKKTTTTVQTSARAGERFSGFVVPVSDILYSNTEVLNTGPGRGYPGNPRIGKCTYPTVMWKITGVPQTDAQFLYSNLNSTDPTITLKS